MALGRLLRRVTAEMNSIASSWQDANLLRGRYELIGSEHDARPNLARTRNPPTRRALQLITVCLIGLVIAIVGLVYTGNSSQDGPGGSDKGLDISKYWGHYSPAFTVPSDIDPSTPPGCDVNFGLVLSRHGARYPTAHKSEKYNRTIARIQKNATSYGKGYEWLQDYVYSLGAADLTEFGQHQMVDSGKAFFDRYTTLARKSEPFIRASGADRVIMSSYNFTQGFYSRLNTSGSDEIRDILIVPEGEGHNNTMSHGNCDFFERQGVLDDFVSPSFAWRDNFAPAIAQRVNNNLPGAQLSLEETLWLMDLCPFNTVNSANLTHSGFCRLFTEEEWRDYDYFLTLSKYYKYGSGNRMGPTQGVGYVNELVARLTRQPVQDHTTTNRTLDSSPDTFPLDRVLFADFSHDNTMVSIFSALGLYNLTGTLPVDHVIPASKAHGYSSAWVVPFAGAMYIEKMECATGTAAEAAPEEYVRVLINERVMPLETCGGDQYGRCKLDKFVDSLSFARGGGFWDRCAQPQNRR